MTSIDFYRAALNAGQSRHEKAVRLSVRPSIKRVHCDKMEERSVQIFIPYERSLSLVFWEEEWLVESDPFLHEIFGQPASLSKIVNFQLIFAHGAWPVASSKKSSINTNRKSTMHFPVSLRWTFYVVP